MNFRILTKTTFIFNLCFLAALLFRQFGIMPDNAFKSSVIISGYLLSFVFNGVAASWFIVLLFQERSLKGVSNHWLAVINLLFLIIQLYLLAR